MANNSEDTVVASLQSLTLNDNELPIRPGFGTVGTAIKLRTNFFPVKVPKGPLYEYDVAIAQSGPTPREVTVRRLKRRIFQLAEQTNDWGQANMTGRVAHDHSSKLISVFQLPQPLVIRVPYTDEDEGDVPPQPAKPKGGKKGGGKKPLPPKEYTLTITYIQDLETESLVKYVLALSSSHKAMQNVLRCIPPEHSRSGCLCLQTFACFCLLFFLVLSRTILFDPSRKGSEVNAFGPSL